MINKANWMKIGIKVDIKNYPPKTFFDSFLTEAKPGSYDITEFSESGAYDPDNASILQCGQTAIFSHYCNPKMNALLQQEQSSGDPVVRQQAFDGILTYSTTCKRTRLFGSTFSFTLNEPICLPSDARNI